MCLARDKSNLIKSVNDQSRNSQYLPIPNGKLQSESEKRGILLKTKNQVIHMGILKKCFEIDLVIISVN